MGDTGVDTASVMVLCLVGARTVGDHHDNGRYVVTQPEPKRQTVWSTEEVDLSEHFEAQNITREPLISHTMSFTIFKLGFSYILL